MVYLDRFTQGAIAGFIGTIPLELWFSVSRRIGINDSDFIDCAKTLLFDQPYSGFLQKIIATGVNFGIGISFGIFFSYLMLIITDRFYLLKGIWFGLAVALFHNVIGTALSLPHFRLPPVQALNNLMSSVVFGYITALVWKKLDVFVID